MKKITSVLILGMVLTVLAVLTTSNAVANEKFDASKASVIERLISYVKNSGAPLKADPSAEKIVAEAASKGEVVEVSHYKDGPNGGSCGGGNSVIF